MLDYSDEYRVGDNMSDDEYRHPMTMREIMEDEHPVDYERQRQEYYDKKTLHREEVLPALGVIIVVAFLVYAGMQVYAVINMWITS